VIESGAAPDGPAATIKLHHNVGGLPEQLGFELGGTLRDLFKDEVRTLGSWNSDCLNISSGVIRSQALDLRSDVSAKSLKAKLEVLRDADDIVITEIKNADLYRSTSQAFVVLLEVAIRRCHG
jgi:GMP synthase (glutamine-hydrolysing)